MKDDLHAIHLHPLKGCLLEALDPTTGQMIYKFTVLQKNRDTS